MSKTATAGAPVNQKYTNRMPTSTHAGAQHRRKKPATHAHMGKDSSKDKMSLEAQVAMQLGLEDSRRAKVKTTAAPTKLPVMSKPGKDVRRERQTGRTSRSPRATSMEKIPETRAGGRAPRTGSARKDSGSGSSAADGVERGGSLPRKNPSFKDLYEMHESMRMHRDITDANFDERNLPRQALGGGKIENAMEIVEIVNADEPPPLEVDVDTIEELARINSMEKVQIWMQATDQEEADCEPPEELDPIPEGRVKHTFSLGGTDIPRKK